MKVMISTEICTILMMLIFSFWGMINESKHEPSWQGTYYSENDALEDGWRE